MTYERTTDVEEFTDESWAEFLALPLNNLVGESGGGGFDHPSSGFDDRYRLALTIVTLLSFVGLAIGAAMFISSQRRTAAIVTTDIDAPAAPLACDAIDLRSAAVIPGRTSCSDGELIATGDLDAGWNGMLSGWDVPNEMDVRGVWENWDDGTPLPNGIENWRGSDAHSNVDPADNRYQEIQVATTASGSFSIFEHRGLTGRSVTFTFVPTGDTAEQNGTLSGPAGFAVTSGRPIAVSGAGRTSVLWSGELSDDDITVDWDGNNEPTATTVLAGSLIANDALISSVTGSIHLSPGDDGTETDAAGGLFLRLYQQRALGLAGGKSAQLGLVNTRMGPIVDRTSGICPHDACSVRASTEYTTAETVDLDASSGIGFSVAVADDVMTLRMWSLADRTAAESTVSMPWEGGLAAAGIEIWATDWSFAGHFDDVRIAYN